MVAQSPTCSNPAGETRGMARAGTIEPRPRNRTAATRASASEVAAQMCRLGNSWPGTREFEVAAEAFVRRSLEPESSEFVVAESGVSRRLTVVRQACGILTYAEGLLWEIKFHVNDAWGHYTALVHAPLDVELRPQFPHPDEILVRIDSGCETGQLYGEKTCECKEQLETAIRRIFAAGQGVIVNIPAQDGRGHGIGPKLATLTAQQLFGIDTVEAARLVNVGKPIDVRTYGGAVAVLRFLGVEPGTKLLSMTNNPEKLAVLRKNQFDVEPVPLVIPATEFTRHHLQAKSTCLGHHALREQDAA